MWADSTYEKEVWVDKLLQTIENLKNKDIENSSSKNTDNTYKLNIF